MKLLLCLTILISGSGCCTIPVEAPIGAPEPPVLDSLTLEMQQRTPPDVLEWTATTVRELKAYAKQLSGRIQAHDETL